MYVIYAGQCSNYISLLYIRFVFLVFNKNNTCYISIHTYLSTKSETCIRHVNASRTFRARGFNWKNVKKIPENQFSWEMWEPLINWSTWVNLQKISERPLKSLPSKLKHSPVRANSENIEEQFSLEDLLICLWVGWKICLGGGTRDAKFVPMGGM